jgi:hypothetical protein
MRKPHVLFIIFIFGMILISCTREIDESVIISIDTSNLNRGNSSYSSPNSQSIPDGYYPKILLANLHYDNKTEVFEWKCSHNTSLSSCVYPSTVTFGNKKFPNGSGRVVQVLLIYENEAEQLLFYYANALNLNFAGGVLNVTISNWVNNGSALGTGNVAGRFFDVATETGPTGKLIGSYSPPRPAGLLNNKCQT